MAIERNIIFVYPITTQLKELKDELEKEGECVIYELDSVGEYIQIIAIVEHSITFSSDIKKTEGYLKKCKKFITKKNNKNYLLQENNVSPRMFGKYQRAGLDEVILDNVSVKSLSHKINMFFTPLEQAEKKIEEDKNKAVTGDMKLSKTSDLKKDNREEYNNNERQRIEKTVDMTDDLGAFGNTRKDSGFAADFMLGGGDSSNLELKKNKTDSSMLQSPFDQFQRKNVAQFNAVDAEKKLKKASFVPVMGELKQNPHAANQESDKGDLKRKKTTKLDFPPKEFERRKKNFEEVFADLKKKKGKFVEVEAEIKKKKAALDMQLGEMNKKKLKLFKEAQADPKKKKKFEEVFLELEKRKAELEDIEAEAEKKKKSFQTIEIDFEKKRKNLDDEHLDYDKKRSLFEEIEALKKKKSDALSEWEEFDKKRKSFEESLADTQLKRKTFEEADEFNKKDGAHLEFGELDKKKGKAFEEVSFEKKHLDFEEVELDLEKKRKTFEEANTLDLKKSKFEEVDLDKKKRASFEEISKETKKKNGTFEGMARERNFSNEEDLSLQKDFKLEDGLFFEEKKEFEEQTLDYGQFKKDHKEVLLAKEKANDKVKKQKDLEALLDEPEYTFYENQSFGLEFLVIYNDFLLKEKTNHSDLFKFIHFALMKSYEADISLYLVTKILENDEKKWKCLYSGHRARKNLVLKNDIELYEPAHIQSWLGVPIPTWSDMTFQEELLEFVYPYFEDGELLGCAVCHFRNTVRSHSDAAKVEILTVCLKGAMLEEFELKGGNK